MPLTKEVTDGIVRPGGKEVSRIADKYSDDATRNKVQVREWHTDLWPMTCRCDWGTAYSKKIQRTPKKTVGIIRAHCSAKVTLQVGKSVNFCGLQLLFPLWFPYTCPEQ